MEGKIIKSTGSWYTVRTENGEYVNCRIKGKFRMAGFKSTNPLAVGDLVEWEIESNSENGVITVLKDRKNYIIRKSINLSKETHIIASNIDQAILVVTLISPRTSTGFIDRFLLTAEAYHIPTLLIINKIDMFSAENEHFLQEFEDLYSKVGYPIYRVSAITEQGIPELHALLKDKTTLISGHSGVGKSTLINKILPDSNIRTSEISKASNKGVHTTTFAEMFETADNGFIIDTPGIREFGIVHFQKEDISHYFIDMKPLLSKCRFHNCVHVNEPGCAVLEAVKSGEIAESRYQNYLSIYFNDNNRN